MGSEPRQSDPKALTPNHCSTLSSQPPPLLSTPWSQPKLPKKIRKCLENSFSLHPSCTPCSPPQLPQPNLPRAPLQPTSPTTTCWSWQAQPGRIDFIPRLVKGLITHLAHDPTPHNDRETQPPPSPAASQQAQRNATQNSAAGKAG